MDGGENNVWENETVQGGRVRQAILVSSNDEQNSIPLAFGEVREDEGLFIVNRVFTEGADVEVAGGVLAEMAGEMVPLQDLDAADLGFDWLEPEEEQACEGTAEGMTEAMAADVQEGGGRRRAGH